jgi:O-antigen/teichoic acid export membrane protein
MSVSHLRTVIHGSLWSVLQNVVRTGISFVSVPLTIGKIGADRYGLWMLALSVSSVMSFMDVGLTPVLLNRLAESHARGDMATFRKYVRSAATMSVCLVALSFIIAAAGASLNWVAIARISDPVAIRESRPLFGVVFLLGLLGVALGPIENVLSARMQIIRPRIYGFASAVVSFMLLLVGLRLNVSLPTLAALTGAPSLYRLCLLPSIARDPDLPFTPSWGDFRQMLRELLPSSSLFVVIQAAAAATSFLPNVLIARSFGLTDVALFSVSTRLAGLPTSVAAAVLPAFWPAFTIAWHRGEKGRVRQWLGWACFLTGVALAIYCALITLIGPRFVSYWTRGRLQPETLMLFALGCGAVGQGILNWLSTFLHSMTDLRFEAVSYVSTAILVGTSAALAASMGSLVLFAFAVATAPLIGNVLPMFFRVRRWLSGRV